MSYYTTEIYMIDDILKINKLMEFHIDKHNYRIQSNILIRYVTLLTH